MDWEAAHGLKRSSFAVNAIWTYNISIGLFLKVHLISIIFDHFDWSEVVKEKSNSPIINEAIQHINQHYFERLF